MNNIPVFVVNTAEAFNEQLLATAPEPATRSPNPEKLAAFVAKHPEFARGWGYQSSGADLGLRGQHLQ